MSKNLLPLEKLKHKILVKKEAATDPSQGCSPKKRPIEQLMEYGVVDINKPAGPTSHQISYYVKKILNLDKSGHSGTLDPKVTGVLAVALSKATRIVQILLPSGKEYIAIMRLHDKVSKKQIEKTFKKFTGKIEQLPPVRSAVKRKLRQRSIYYAEILDIREKDVLFKVGCEAGTYIRKLIHDMGQAMGTGAHMAQLVRTKAGPFNDKSWHTLQDLKDAYETYRESGDEKPLRKIIEPFENAVAHMKKVWILDTAVSNICHGSLLAPQGISQLHDSIEPGDPIAVMTLKEELICIGTAKMGSKDLMKKNRGIAISTKKVFMERDTYSRQKGF